MISKKKFLCAVVGACMIFLPVVAVSATAQKTYNWKVTGVVDGDTLSVDASKDFALPIKIRLRGVDTPEKGSLAKCSIESSKAITATLFTQAVLADAAKKNTPVVFKNIGWDKYGGRVLAEVMVGQKSLSNMLIDSGLAKPYDGGKKSSWCE